MNENLLTIKATLAAFGTTMGAFLGWKGIMLVSWVLVMAIDYITGTAAACKDHEWQSSMAREGIWHKCGMIAVVVVAAIADWIMVLIAHYIPIGIQWPGLIMPLVLAWYILTELGSILENSLKMGASVPGWLVKILKASADFVEDAGEHTVIIGDTENHNETVEEEINLE